MLGRLSPLGGVAVLQSLHVANATSLGAPPAWDPPVDWVHWVHELNDALALDTLPHTDGAIGVLDYLWVLDRDQLHLVPALLAYALPLTYGCSDCNTPPALPHFGSHVTPRTHCIAALIATALDAPGSEYLLRIKEGGSEAGVRNERLKIPEIGAYLGIACGYKVWFESPPDVAL